MNKYKLQNVEIHDKNITPVIAIQNTSVPIQSNLKVDVTPFKPKLNAIN